MYIYFISLGLTLLKMGSVYEYSCEDDIFIFIFNVACLCIINSCVCINGRIPNLYYLLVCLQKIGTNFDWEVGYDCKRDLTMVIMAMDVASIKVMVK